MPWHRAIDRWLQPAESTVNLILIGVIVLCVAVLLIGNRTIKTAVAAWLLLP